MENYEPYNLYFNFVNVKGYGDCPMNSYMNKSSAVPAFLNMNSTFLLHSIYFHFHYLVNSHQLEYFDICQNGRKYEL